MLIISNPTINILDQLNNVNNVNNVNNLNTGNDINNNEANPNDLNYVVCTNRREEILNGYLLFPKQIKDILNPNEDLSVLTDMFFEALWHNFLLEKTLDTVTWLERFHKLDEKYFNTMIYHLTNAGWINCSVEMNYSYIELKEDKLFKWITAEELRTLRLNHKLDKYVLTAKRVTKADLVKINMNIRHTGLIRAGFAKQGNALFKYDTHYINKYAEDIAFNIYKSQHTSQKDITYEESIELLLKYYGSKPDNNYKLNVCVIDSRGRHIYQCMKKILNPISHKDARASLRVAPRALTPSGETQVYLAVAELLGYKPATLEESIELGREAVANCTLPTLFKGDCGYYGDELHKYIWLERIYYNFEHKDQWEVPIEIDAYNSILQYIGVLTNNHMYLLGTNLAENNNKLSDMWLIPNVNRLLVKKAVTPILYGSSATPTETWDNLKLPYTKKDSDTINLEILTGRFCQASKFKDFIISNVKPSVKMDIEILDDRFFIKCDKFNWEKTLTKTYFVYSENKMRKITRDVTLVPDLKQFKLYFPTLLCHNLDSQVANFIGYNMSWVLPNHDSFTLHPNDAMQCKELYKYAMTAIYKKRHSILDQFFTSVGITKSFDDVDDKELTLSINALK